MRRVLLVGMICLLASCNKKHQEKVNDAEILHKGEKALTDVIVHDIFSPPVSSRIYAYANIAAYEVLVKNNPKYKSLAGQLNGLNSLPPPTNEKIDYSLAATSAFFAVGKKMVFSEADLQRRMDELLDWYKTRNGKSENWEASITYGKQIADSIIKWSAKDNYKETRAMTRYQISDKSGTWKPTPPAYMTPVEPYWGKIRPFFIDSAIQFKPAPPPVFNLSKHSEFYKLTLEVYETGQTLTKEQNEIASFWDCNPFVVNPHGHLAFANKKISPGGHWMGIAAIAARNSKADIMKTAETYTLASLALMDGFISCWDEKFRSNVIRPETVINSAIDENWRPLLQTPPFPEYPSGHSVISTAAAVALTSIYGDKFAFTDSVEVEYGLTARRFTSFKQAAEEAAISRLYGGIHYRSAIVNGCEQGRKIGEYLIKKIKTRHNPF